MQLKTHNNHTLPQCYKNTHSTPKTIPPNHVRRSNLHEVARVGEAVETDDVCGQNAFQYVVTDA